MAAVVLEITQGGSGSVSIHAEPGDLITLELSASTNVYANALQNTIDNFSGLTDVTGVNFAVNTAGGAATPLTITQSGSANAVISAEIGDTVALQLSGTVFNNVAGQIVKWLQGLTVFLGVTFSLNPAGAAS
jgi:hypothetical protein